MKNVDNSNLDNNVVFNESRIKLGSSKQNIFKKIFNSFCVFACCCCQHKSGFKIW